MKNAVLIPVLFIALAGVSRAAPVDKIRLTPDEVAAKEGEGAGAGTSGVTGIQMTVLLGDPAKPGLYTIRLRIPANTRIEAHTHRDDRSAVVMAGTWYFGYGNETDESATRSLGPGSFYTEPSGVAHFALTKAEPAVVVISGFGPSDTVYVKSANDPRKQH